jgi:hypothetical protein
MPEIAKPERLRLLLLSRNEELCQLRVHIFRNAGYWTEQPNCKRQADDLIESQQFDALVICYTVLPESACSLIPAFRARNPGAPVIGIYYADWSDPPYQTDLWIHNLDGPVVLLNGVAGAIHK